MADGEGQSTRASSAARAQQLRRQAEEGSAEAAAALAIHHALGLGVDPSWDAALDWLEQAAVRGDAGARAQLAVATADKDLGRRLRTGGGTPAAWRKAREAVDVPAWLSVEPPRRVSAAPLIAVSPHLLDPPTCRWLIRRAERSLAPAFINDVATGEARIDPARTNFAAALGHPDLDLLTVLIQHRLAAAAGVAFDRLETVNVLRYEAGQAFAPHHDYFDTTQPDVAAGVARSGQRTATVLVYLNEDYEGGATDFPLIRRSFRGDTGDALVFANVGEDGRPDPLTLHAGLPTTSGVKWVLSQWVRGPAAP
jgi:prolyl 4-hydroxylase